MKIDIIIKSFNRPYYLDRCLYSINQFVQNHDGNIIIIDDGTPLKYLNRIQKLHPKVKIFESNLYYRKTNEIVKNSTSQIQEVPIKAWIFHAEKSTDYFLLLEDDMWFTQAFDFNNIKEFVTQNKLTMLKMSWLKNEAIINTKNNKSTEYFIEYEPNVITKNPYLFKLIFNSHRTGISKLFELLKLNSVQNLLPYYSIYSVAGILFNKEYFLSLWNGHNNKVNESLQITNALKYIQNHDTLFARTKTEFFSTSFISSATSVDNNNTNGFNMILFNSMLNKHWYEEQFNVYEDLSNDLNEQLIYEFLEQENNSKIKPENWKIWVSEFKNQYINLGCKLN